MITLSERVETCVYEDTPAPASRRAGRVRSGLVGLDVNDFRRRNLLCGELNLRHQYLPGTITKRPPTSPKFFRKSRCGVPRADEPGRTTPPEEEFLEHNGVRFASLAESDTLHLVDCG